MKADNSSGCPDSVCAGVRRPPCLASDVDLDPARVSVVLISEAAPEDPADYYYAGEDALFARTTVLAFRDAGAEVSSLQDIRDLGVYLTTAVKCAKTGSGIAAATIEACSYVLEREIARFPNVRAYLLMGDVAIKSINMIAKRGGERRAVPAGPTYKIRGGEFTFRGARVLPSYLQAGAAFFIERSKRRMIAEDIRQALAVVAAGGRRPLD